MADDNPGSCGITLADHTGVGVFDNVIAGNVANHNGFGTSSAPGASAGRGIILADPAPAGSVYDNLVIGNQLSGNSHAGVVIHAHYAGTNFRANVITGNWIGRNNLRGNTDDTQ